MANYICCADMTNVVNDVLKVSEEMKELEKKLILPTPTMYMIIPKRHNVKPKDSKYLEI